MVIKVEQKYKRIWVRINVEYWNKLKVLAMLKGIPVWQLLEEIMIDYFNRCGKEEIAKLASKI